MKLKQYSELKNRLQLAACYLDITSKEYEWTNRRIEILDKKIAEGGKHYEDSCATGR